MMLHIKLMMAAVILLIALIAGIIPFKKKHDHQARFDFPMGEAIACGVFLGAGLIHMLGDSAQEFIALGYDYPFAFLIAGASFLGLLLLEHMGNELEAHHEGNSTHMALLATVMLSIHSLFEGAAVGISGDILTATVLGFAIIAHKWAASFSLALQINKSNLKFNTGLMCFLIFAVMTPVGILLGDAVNETTGAYHLLTPIFSALAAGTFLYIGTLHGLTRAPMIKNCCNIREFLFMILGFGIMALVAIWT
jgi:solute carrier family 39 (zinc transporter), member 1/2/3